MLLDVTVFIIVSIVIQCKRKCWKMWSSKVEATERRTWLEKGESMAIVDPLQSRVCNLLMKMLLIEDSGIKYFHYIVAQMQCFLSRLPPEVAGGSLSNLFLPGLAIILVSVRVIFKKQ
uniref:Uncharacterized protein n=1 Tax=Pyxicephalus adspersus TaxID=30357 RepID=A0AAV3A8V1_PYXAD|nr:TPA: hypothetical protein GDO54_013863 [Pyxicephalus adspersus]